MTVTTAEGSPQQDDRFFSFFLSSSTSSAFRSRGGKVCQPAKVVAKVQLTLSLAQMEFAPTVKRKKKKCSWPAGMLKCIHFTELATTVPARQQLVTAQNCQLAQMGRNEKKCTVTEQSHAHRRTKRNHLRFVLVTARTTILHTHLLYTLLLPDNSESVHQLCCCCCR